MARQGTHLSQEGDVVEVEQGRRLLDRAALHEGEVTRHPGVDNGAALLLREPDLVVELGMGRSARGDVRNQAGTLASKRARWLT